MTALHPTPPRSIVGLLAGGLLDLFSSVRFGISMLAILFVYMAVGSAGVLYPIHPNLFHPDAWVHAQLRQWRPFEMTEFEWFHWWPFDLLMILICANIAVTTVRRIPFRPVNYGVWMIHSGILILVVGSFIYFSTKVEGDAPVIRRQVVARWTGEGATGGAVSVAAVPGNRVELPTPDGAWALEVVDVDPNWEILSGDAKGERGYSVSVMVDRPDGTRFIRQAIAGHPDLTEDLLFTSDTTQPVKRAVKETGTPLVEDALSLDLAYRSQDWFYLRNEIEKSWAIYLRPVGASAWIERPIEDLPLYNDYLADRSWVFPIEGQPPLPIDPIDLPVPAVAEDDPLRGTDLRVTGYLRYAVERTRLVAGGPGDPLNPIAFMTISSERGEESKYELEALDPVKRRDDGGLLVFRSISSEEELAPFLEPPVLRFSIPSQEFVAEIPVRSVLLAQEEQGFADLGDTGYAYRVVAVQDEIPLSSGVASIAIIEIRTPDARILRRWVFDDARLTRDVAPDGSGPIHSAPTLLDDAIIATYRPGTGLALIKLVAGPEPNRLRLLNTIGSERPEVLEIAPGRAVEVPGGLTVLVTQYLPKAKVERKPWIVPPSQRDRDAGNHFAMIRVEAPGMEPRWLRFHQYAFEGPQDQLRRFRFEPQRIALSDGREVELLFSRQRLPLPAEIALEEFVLTAHVGGFTGESGTIRNWTSLIRFRDQQGWTDPMPVSVNDPVEHGGLSFFQAQWDPPDPARAEGERASRGLNYTVLGVGNRHGIVTQLAGCTISVMGMLYAFYLKPVIRRRQLEQAAKVATSSPRREHAMAGATT